MELNVNLHALVVHMHYMITTNWIRAGEAEDKYALVVVSDIAKI